MDALFSILSANRKLPEGWGFPSLGHEEPEPPVCSELTKKLIPFEDEEGVAQAVRWYYGLILSYPDLAMGISLSPLDYVPDIAWKPPIEVSNSSVHLTASPKTGLLKLGWTPGPEDRHLIGEIVPESLGLKMTLGSKSFDLGTPSSNNLGRDIYTLNWPSFLRLEAAFKGDPSGKTFKIVFRPTSFDADSFSESVSKTVGESWLIESGLIKRWQFADPEEKLAIAWVCVQNLRHGWKH